MPRPIPDESLLGYVSRALSRTVCNSLYLAFNLIGKVHAKQRPRPYNLTTEDVDGLARLFKVDPEQFRARLYPWGTFEHAEELTIEFFGTKIRAQYFEAEIRRVSPRSLSISPHHKAIWDLRPFSFDPDTRERLLDRCPICKSRLGWSTMYGPFRCDKCAKEQGLSTDLRDFPQPIIEVDDEEAVNFVVGLVDPSLEKRAAAMRLVPDELSSATSSDLFDAVISIASVLSPANARRTHRVGRPKTVDEFAELTPDRLALAVRALIGGESDFGNVADAMRVFMSQRPASHGVFKELGPLAAIAGDRRIAPAVRSHVKTAIERDLARTQNVSLVRRRTTQIGRHVSDEWLNINELNGEFGLRDVVLKRLADSGHVATKRVFGATAPIQMRRTEVAPFIACYKGAVSERTARGMLKVSSAVLTELAERKIIERTTGATVAMLGNKAHFTRSSINAVLIAIKKRARPKKANSTSIQMFSAVRTFGSHDSWATIISLILTGDIVVRRSGSRSNDWRRNVAIDDLNEFCRAVENAGGTEKGRREKWVSREQAAQILGVANLAVIGPMSGAGLLNPRIAGGVHIYKRAEIEAAAKKYIFGPEMLERTVFNAYHELNRWLRSHGVEPEFQFDGPILIFNRKAFDGVIPFQPPLLQKLTREGRFYSIEEKKQVVEAVLAGSPVGYVSRHMGCRLRLVVKWLEEYRASGQITSNTKLDGCRNRLHLIIEENPKLTRREIMRLLENEGVKVSANSIFRFMKKLDYFQDSDGNYRRRTQTVSALPVR
ncbi:transposase-like protein [Nitrobacteraceae bacterium AZCC 2299]